MADIRCLPGMEGCPVFGEHERFIGILTRPLRQKTSGAEIQLVIPWEAIATACDDRNPVKRNPFYIRKSNSIGNTHLSNYDSDQIIKSPVEKAMASICLITIDNGAWASGVLLNKYGLILTNAHLLEPWRFGKITTYSERDEIETEEIARPPNRRIRVRLDCLDPWIWSNAKVVYVSKGPLDVALLKLEFVPDKICPIDVDFTRPIPGSKACVIGHGLFGPRSDLLPSVSHGVIAKVVETKRPNKDIPLPAMIETTAAVHPGGSGGAVVNLDGHMIGLVTSNARHGGGTVIPYLNFSISSSALEPIFRFSKDMKDVLPLEELNEPNEDLSSVWDLMPPLSPEPGPTLPNLLPGENKDIKGSRFAKFITERHEELKKTSPEGKTKSFSSRFTLSKL